MAEITGRHVFAVFAGAFGLIIAVNLTLAFKAVSTFPGLEVANSYVASQTFDKERTAQLALGWTLATAYDAQAKVLRLNFTDSADLPAEVKELNVLVGRTTEAREDQRPEFTLVSGGFEAPLDLNPGKWLLRVDAIAANGTLFSQRIYLRVPG
ncbi:FixH family protein [Rhodobacter ferrooxidans]|uniref:FixH family protein n=1 Tax=Rhodobacter ferrooxidans TaxID=371731 RepID=C8RWM4_9RHOB|nr:FixH family protein [Rhodobacter sp. SW2]EEW26967.1 FixH family protein [Rhodobacter sp. SW2]